MSTRNWHWAHEPGTDGIALGKFASAAYSRNLAKASAANYALCKRNVLCFTTNKQNNAIVPGGDATDSWNRWLYCPIGGRIVGPGTLKVWIFAKSSQEGAANDVYVQTKIGYDVSEDTMTLDSGDPAWTEITLSLLWHYDPGVPLEISFKTESDTTITVYSISAYQTGDSNAPDFIDVSGGVLGTADGPDDVYAMRLLRDQVVSVRGWKVPRNNVFNHWYHQAGTAAVAYSANNNRLGAFKFAKRRGISEVILHFLAGKDTDNGDVFVRAEISGLDNAPAEGVDQATEITDAITAAPGWYSVTWTINAADVDTEFECEVILDGKSSAADYLFFAGYSLLETDPDASHAHTVPDPANFKMGNPIKAAQHENVWDTCHHLYYYGGRQICAADWYLPYYDAGSTTWTSAIHCDIATTPGDADFDKRQWWAWNGISDKTGIVIARALLFSSTSSKRLRVRMGYHTTAGSSYTKTIHMCSSETVDTVHCTHVDANPTYEDDANNDHDFTRAIDGADGRPGQVQEACYLDIDSGDWEEQGTGAVAQAFIQSITSNAAEYIIPDWVSIEEVVLSPNEFP